MAVVEHPDRNGLNARQTMLKFKKAHGSGINLDYPDAAKIQEAMTGFDDNHKVPIYGDGSFTTPTKWWAALGGYGIWIPEWNPDDATTTYDDAPDDGSDQYRHPAVLIHLGLVQSDAQIWPEWPRGSNRRGSAAEATAAEQREQLGPRFGNRGCCPNRAEPSIC